MKVKESRTFGGKKLKGHQMSNQITS